jgi:hypothetical protein
MIVGTIKLSNYPVVRNNFLIASEYYFDLTAKCNDLAGKRYYPGEEFSRPRRNPAVAGLYPEETIIIIIIG